jgi:hypothetical protein
MPKGVNSAIGQFKGAILSTVQKGTFMPKGVKSATDHKNW